MKRNFLILLAGVFYFFACSTPSENQLPEKIHIYDSALAQKYGADDYGMKKFVFAFLKRGPNQTLDSLQRAELQRAHLKNITRLADQGKLLLAGPFFGNDELRGIYIFNVETMEEAEALINTDPSIQAGVLVMELREWYGSAALLGLNDTHKRLQKQNIAGD